MFALSSSSKHLKTVDVDGSAPSIADFSSYNRKSEVVFGMGTGSIESNGFSAGNSCDLRAGIDLVWYQLYWFTLAKDLNSR
jgi:hypothetical protein